MPLYDFIYADLKKVISLYSQMTGGVVEVREKNNEESQSSDNKRHYNVKFFEHDAGGTRLKKSASREVIKPHHALLTEMEDELEKNGYLVDLTKPETDVSFRDSAFRTRLKDTFCIKIRGRTIIEDYERLKSIAAVFPDITTLVNKSAELQLRASPEFIELQNGLKKIEKQLKATKDRNTRSKEKQQLESLKEAIARELNTATSVKVVEQWILDGIQTWVDAFLPGIVNLRVYPYIDRPEEHVFGHLKKECFEDLDPNSFHFTYGSFPTESLTMIGIVTSVPDEHGEQFNPLVEFNDRKLGEHEVVEQGFRAMFRGSDGMEQMIRTCRFPRVLVHPLTVYRSVVPNHST